MLKLVRYHNLILFAIAIFYVFLQLSLPKDLSLFALVILSSTTVGCCYHNERKIRRKIYAPI